MSDNTETVEVGGVEYTLRTRLGWYEQEKVDGKAFRMFAEGKALNEADDLADLKQIEIVMNTADHTLARLQARLVMNRNKIKAIPPSHVPILVARIEELETEQEREVRELQVGNPIVTVSDA